MSGLEKLTQAERMLAEVRTVDEAQHVRDLAEAARVYAKQMKLGTQSVNHATFVKIRAERRLADVVDEGQRDGVIEGHGGDRIGESKTRAASLEDIGVESERLAEARLLRDIFTEEELAQRVLESDAADREVYRTGLLREARQIVARERRAKAVTEPVAPPDGKYRCIVIDPPWPMRKIERDERPDQGVELDYPVMSLDEIADEQWVPVRSLADDDCHLYLWVTHKFLPAGLELLDGWGFNYQCIMTWRKNVGITPYSWMYDTEHVLFGRRGNLPLEKLGLRLSFDALVTGHSIKPDIFYERVTEASPGPRLDMFARRERDGFDSWGNEVAV